MHMFNVLSVEHIISMKENSEERKEKNEINFNGIHATKSSTVIDDSKECISSESYNSES